MERARPFIVLLDHKVDADRASKIRRHLAEAGLHVWSHRFDLTPGALTDLTFEDVLSRASHVLYVVGATVHDRSAGEDDWDEREAIRRVIALHHGDGCTIISVLLDGALARMPFGLQRVMRFDLDMADLNRLSDMLLGAGGTSYPPTYPGRSSDAALLQQLRDRERQLRIDGAPTVEIDEVTQQRIALEHEIRARRAEFPQCLGGRFYLKRPLGKGSWGDVSRYFDAESERDVAVKVLSERLSHDKSAVERFKRGAQTMSRLEHPAIVRIVQSYREESGRHYYAMALMARDLHDTILQRRERPSWEHVLNIVLSVADGLAFAHASGVVHRDIKPRNILLDGITGQACLADFDLVKTTRETHGTQTGPLGSMPYAAPEQLTHPQHAGPAADVFSLGMTLVFGLDGRELPPNLTPNELDDRVRSLMAWPQLSAVLRQATQRDPEKRYPTATEFRAALQYAIQHKPAHDEVDRVLESLGTHRRCIEADLFDLLSVRVIRDVWRSLPDGPRCSTRRFLDGHLWSESQRLVHLPVEDWMAVVRPALERQAYADWLERSGVRDAATIRADQPRPLTVDEQSELRRAGWLADGDQHGATIFRHARLACWALASAIAVSRVLPEELTANFTLQLVRSGMAHAEPTDPERSVEFPCDLLWHLIGNHRWDQAAGIIEAVWRWGWRAGHVRDVLVEVGAQSLWGLMIYFERQTAKAGDAEATLLHDWLADDFAARIAKRDPTIAEQWALRACSHPIRTIREFAYAVAASCGSPTTAGHLFDLYLKRRARHPLEDSSRARTRDSDDDHYETKWLFRRIEESTRKAPHWLLDRLEQVARDDRKLAIMLVGALVGSAGRQVWLGVKSLFLSDAAPSECNQLSALIRRFVDVAETDRCLRWLDAGVNEHIAPERAERRGWVLQIDLLIETLAVLSPSEIPLIMSDRLTTVAADIPPSSMLRALHLRDRKIFLKVLNFWLLNAERAESDRVIRDLTSIAGLLPASAINHIIGTLTTALAIDGDEPRQKRRVRDCLECLTAARTNGALHLLESLARAPIAEALAALCITQLSDMFGHIPGDGSHVLTRMGGEQYRDYALTRLCHGKVGHRQTHGHVAFLPAPVDWSRVEAAEEEFGRDDFTMGVALALHGEHRRLTDWILCRGVNGTGRYFSDTESATGPMDPELVQMVSERLSSGSCSLQNALLALGMMGNHEAMNVVCEAETTDDDETFVRVVALRWLASTSVTLLDDTLARLPPCDEAARLDVLWHCALTYDASVQMRAEALLMESTSKASNTPSGRHDSLMRYEQMAEHVAERLKALNWPPKNGKLPCWGRWPRREDVGWDRDEMRAGIRAGSPFDSAQHELVRYHATDPEDAYALALNILREEYRSTSGLPELLVEFDPARAVSDLWFASLEADIRLRHRIAVALDQVEPRSRVAVWLNERVHSDDAQERRRAFWMLGWQTDGLLNAVMRDRLSIEFDAAHEIVEALERQRRARAALQLLLELPDQSLHGQRVRLDVFCDICKPSDVGSPDGWAVWRRSGRPDLCGALRTRMKDQLSTVRTFDRQT